MTTDTSPKYNQNLVLAAQHRPCLIYLSLSPLQAQLILGQNRKAHAQVIMDSEARLGFYSWCILVPMMVMIVTPSHQATPSDSYDSAESSSDESDSDRSEYEYDDDDSFESSSESESINGEESAVRASQELKWKCAPKASLTAQQKKHVNGWGYESRTLNFTDCTGSECARFLSVMFFLYLSLSLSSKKFPAFTG